MQSSSQPILIAGAGIIGLSLALELHTRGHAITVFDRGLALQQASTAAAGMLAAEDPHNPAALRPLADLSLSLYDAFLARIESFSHQAVPFQTHTTVQYHRDHTHTTLHEHSLDPRQLADSLLAAVRNTAIDLREHTPAPSSITVDTTGAWSPAAIPRKGQMLAVELPAALHLEQVHRSEDVYIVPRLQGPHAGTAVIGATMEDAGFDTTVHPADLARLRSRAAALLPALADAPIVASWAGLRPCTPDELPLIGQSQNHFIATGHFRNGILLAPGTAIVLADLIEGRTPPLDVSPFDPARFD